MRRRLLLILLVLVLGMSIADAATLNAYEQVASNEFLELFVNPDSAEIAVYDKQTKEFWYSNPPNRGREEKVARGKALERLGAQLIFTYFTQVGAEITLDSYNDSVVFNQIEISPIDDGVRIDFTFGEEWSEGAF